MRIGAFQFDVRRGDVPGNLAEAERGLRAARDGGLEFVSLPEMWPTSFVAADVAGGDDERWLAESEEAVARIRDLSAELELVVCGSAFGSLENGPPWANRLHVFDSGRDVFTYDKVHLFSPTAEHLSFAAGNEPPPTHEVRGLRLSALVCYDLRFGALLRTPFLQEAELLVVPAQWPDTRREHWRALVCGRAAEHQAFVLGANRTGKDLVGRRELELAFPGNSLVCGPGGEVLAEGAGAVGLVTADIDLEGLRALRRQVPVRRDERGDVYARG